MNDKLCGIEDTICNDYFITVFHTVFRLDISNIISILHTYIYGHWYTDVTYWNDSGFNIFMCLTPVTENYSECRFCMSFQSRNEGRFRTMRIWSRLVSFIFYNQQGYDEHEYDLIYDWWYDLKWAWAICYIKDSYNVDPFSSLSNSIMNFDF